MLALDVAGSPAFLEPDAVVVHPDGSWTVVEIKSFPMLDGSADPAKVGAAARQSAVYVLALEEVAAARVSEPARGRPARVRHQVLLVCPKDFSNLPTAVRRRRPQAARGDPAASWPGSPGSRRSPTPSPRAPASPPTCPPRS